MKATIEHPSHLHAMDPRAVDYQPILDGCVIRGVVEVSVEQGWATCVLPDITNGPGEQCVQLDASGEPIIDCICGLWSLDFVGE
jgi:hypothetical protein